MWCLSVVILNLEKNLGRLGNAADIIVQYIYLFNFYDAHATQRSLGGIYQDLVSLLARFLMIFL